MTKRITILCPNIKLFQLAKYALIIRFLMSGYDINYLNNYMDNIKYSDRNKIIHKLNNKRNIRINEILKMRKLPYKKDWINPIYSNVVKIQYENAISNDDYIKLINHYKYYYPNKMIVYNINDSIFAQIRKYCAINNNYNN